MKGLYDKDGIDGPFNRACDRVARKTTTTEAWNAKHAPHGEPTKRYAKVQPPPGSYKLVEVVCPCGAILVEMER